MLKIKHSVLILAFTAISFKGESQLASIAVIELFSSQGCSSCPSADRLLAKTIDEAKKDGRKIFALEFHVDYWDRLGWKDPFSSKQFTQRQEEYATALNSDAYTPQMVVNGSTEFVGSKEPELNAALSKALSTKAIAGFKTLTTTMENGKPYVHYELLGDYAGCKINFALISLSESTYIKHGENNGLTSVNKNVVRQFISAPCKASGELTFAADPLPSTNNIAIIAYIQRDKDLKIVGAAMADSH